MERQRERVHEERETAGSEREDEDAKVVAEDKRTIEEAANETSQRVGEKMEEGRSAEVQGEHLKTERGESQYSKEIGHIIPEDSQAADRGVKATPQSKGQNPKRKGNKRRQQAERHLSGRSSEGQTPKATSTECLPARPTPSAESNPTSPTSTAVPETVPNQTLPTTPADAQKDAVRLADHESAFAALKAASRAAEDAFAEENAATTAVKVAEDRLASVSAPVRRLEEATKAREAAKGNVKRRRLGDLKRKATADAKAAGPMIMAAETVLQVARSRLREAEVKVENAGRALAKCRRRSMVTTSLLVV
jgi:hypothetical protein